MRGSIHWQAAQIIQKSTAVQIGQSRHAAKNAAKTRLSERGLTAKSQHLSREVGLHSYEYTRDVKMMLLRVAYHARERFGVRDLEQLRGLHFQAFAESVITAGSVSQSTFSVYLSQLAKIENLLNGYAIATGSGRTYDIRPAIDEMRALAKLTLRQDGKSSRAYERPAALVAAIDNLTHRLGAEIQLAGGLRYYEMAKIDVDQLAGIRIDQLTGEARGVIRLDAWDTKGGKGRETLVASGTYQKLADHVAAHGLFRVDSYSAYLHSIELAAKQTQQNYQASHGLRWNYAQHRYHELTASGRCHEEALHLVSWEMGHERGGITMHYLGC